MSVYPRDGAEVDPLGHSQVDAQMQSVLAMGDAASMMPDFGHDLVPMDFEPTQLSDTPDLEAYATARAQHHQSQPPNQSQDETPDDNNDGGTQDQGSERAMSGPGAGPLPTGHGIALPANTGSTLTEFTKRRNWSQRVIEELKDFMYILTPDGRLIYVSPSTKSLTGHDDNQLLGKFIFDFIHPDDSSVFMREFNESIATGNPLRFFYRFRKPDDTYNIFEAHGHPHLASEAAAFGPNSNASFCRGFFMMARPYPTKNASLLDSFLEHKIENERLQKRIADLKREEQEDLENQRRQLTNAPDGTQSEPMGDRANDQSTNATGTPNMYSNMGPPAKPSPDNSNALTRRNLDEALAASRPDSINDKMARYEGATHIETIEMLTGLRYRDGERSKGISTGAASPTLIRGDAGIAIPVDKDGQRAPGSRSYSGNSPYGDIASNSDKKKKIKVADEYVCTDCGTLDSPEWRKGPNGPKTLCNACGLRWAKKEKKRTGNGNNGGAGGADSGDSGDQQPQNMQSQTPVHPMTTSGLPRLTPNQSATMPGSVGMVPGLLPSDQSMPP